MIRVLQIKLFWGNIQFTNESNTSLDNWQLPYVRGPIAVLYWWWGDYSQGAMSHQPQASNHQGSQHIGGNVSLNPQICSLWYFGCIPSLHVWWKQFVIWCITFILDWLHDEVTDRLAMSVLIESDSYKWFISDLDTDTEIIREYHSQNRLWCISCLNFTQCTTMFLHFCPVHSIHYHLYYHHLHYFQYLILKIKNILIDPTLMVCRYFFCSIILPNFENSHSFPDLNSL